MGAGNFPGKIGYCVDYVKWSVCEKVLLSLILLGMNS